MLEVTNEAAARLAERLSQQQGGGHTFTFVREDHGWRLQLGQVTDGDTVIQHQGRPVLALNTAVVSGLADRTLGLRSSAKGGRLHLGYQS